MLDIFCYKFSETARKDIPKTEKDIGIGKSLLIEMLKKIECMIDNASEFLIVRADKLRIVEFPRSGREKLFQRPFLLQVVMVILVIAILIIPLQLIPNSLISSSLLLTFTKSAFAYHGQEVMLSLNDSIFTPLTVGQGNQVKVLANYNVQNSSIGGQTINAVMKLYTSNGTLIKTSSYPSGFIALNTNGTANLKVL